MLGRGARTLDKGKQCLLFNPPWLFSNQALPKSTQNLCEYGVGDFKLKVRSMTQKVTKTKFQKSFFCISCLIIYPPFSLKRPMDVFISILIRLNFHRRNQKGVKLELLSSLIALLGDKL